MRNTMNMLDSIQNEVYREYAAAYKNIYDSFTQEVETVGLPFNKTPEQAQKAQSLREELSRLGVVSRSEGASLVYQRISPACIACRQGVGSVTECISLHCHRHCYFCFNPNQEDFEKYHLAKKDWKAELEAEARDGDLLCIALTGGEPLLHKDDAVEFFEYCSGRFKTAHKRLYTSGDLLDDETMTRLAKAGLSEIRLSIKMEDPPELREKVLGIMEKAVGVFPSVMVEMPAIPGTKEEMEQLLLRLDAMGIFGINLLEFCFPYCNVHEFQKRGFALKYPPYETLYNFWYAGGLPVDGSEVLCLELMKFAAEHKLKLGVHYCSLENKHTGQIYQQNTEIRVTDPVLYFSDKDFYLKSVLAFGADAKRVRDVLKRKNEIPYDYNAETGVIRFHPEGARQLKGYPMELAVSYSVMELREGCPVARELRLDYTTANEINVDEL